MANGLFYTTTEHKIIRKYCGVISAERIGKIIGRSKYSVQSYIRKQGWDGRLHGEAHHAARTTALRAAMIASLSDCGFRTSEIHSVMSQPTKISESTMRDITAARTWRNL